MKVIDFEKASARMREKEKAARHLPGTGNGVLELQRQYQEYAQFCNRWYDEYVVGQDKDV